MVPLDIATGKSKNYSFASWLISGVISLLNFSNSSCVVIFCCGFIFISLMINKVENLRVLIVHSYTIFFGILCIQIFCLLLIEFSSSYWVVRVLKDIFWTLILCQILEWWVFSPRLWFILLVSVQVEV